MMRSTIALATLGLVLATAMTAPPAAAYHVWVELGHKIVDDVVFCATLHQCDEGWTFVPMEPEYVYGP